MKIDISKYSDLDLALMTICGYFGTGSERRVKLGGRYLKVQILVNQISRGTMPDPPSSGYSKEDIEKAVRAMMPDQADIDAFISDIIGGL